MKNGSYKQEAKKIESKTRKQWRTNKKKKENKTSPRKEKQSKAQ
jgi:hypothetical protein